MYNEELKLEYIKENKDRNFVLENISKRLFNQIEEAEVKFGKDCCEFTISEIIEYYKSRLSTSLESLNVINSNLKLYTNWCMVKKNMVEDHQNHYMEISIELLNQCLNLGLIMNKIISRKDLFNMFKDLDNSCDKALLLGLFEGICGNNMSELLGLRMSDYDGEGFKLCSGRYLKVSKEFANFCEESENNYIYITTDGAEQNLYPGDTGVFKAKNTSLGNNVNRKCLYNKIAKIRNNLGCNYLTTFSLMESGRVDMINNIIKETNQTLDEVLKSRTTEERYGIIRNIKGWEEKYSQYVIREE